MALEAGGNLESRTEGTEDTPLLLAAAFGGKDVLQVPPFTPLVHYYDTEI